MRPDPEKKFLRCYPLQCKIFYLNQVALLAVKQDLQMLAVRLYNRSRHEKVFLHLMVKVPKSKKCKAETTHHKLHPMHSIESVHAENTRIEANPLHFGVLVS